MQKGFYQEYEKAHTPAPLLIEGKIFEIPGLTDKGRNEIYWPIREFVKTGLRRQGEGEVKWFLV